MTADDDKDRALSEIRSDIEVTRQKLAETLDAIEDRLDVPKRIRAIVADLTDRFEVLRKENPTLVYGVLGGAAAAVVATGVLIARGARR
jgi:hypothetical protein